MLIPTKVTFQINDPLIQKLYTEAEQKSLKNLVDFAGRTVLIEGGGYEKIWLETQPMGGEMYAKRNLTAGLNNQLLFMEHIRADGRLPGSIALLDGKIVPQYNKLQGFCFPAHALNLYYLTGCEGDYLTLLYDTLERFDAYLWRVRDSDGDGCLESWCKYDTGEDNALRYGDAPDAWEEETPPKGCTTVPIASVDIMSFSYSARETLAKISRILKKEAWEAEWTQKADRVKQKISAYLWSEERGACFDRDKDHRVMLTLFHNSLRAMYWNSLSPTMAERFVKDHLLNPQEFWTTLPLPSVAVNDPLFRNIPENNWNGQVEALTYQRAIRALENYGYDYLLVPLADKLFHAIGDDCVFVQQYDPFTGAPSLKLSEGGQDAYGPAMLSVLEYIARLYGVHIEQEEIYWGCLHGTECEYTQEWGENTYCIKNTGKQAVAAINGREIFCLETGKKIITDLSGNIKKIISF